MEKFVYKFNRAVVTNAPILIWLLGFKGMEYASAGLFIYLIWFITGIDLADDDNKKRLRLQANSRKKI